MQYHTVSLAMSASIGGSALVCLTALMKPHVHANDAPSLVSSGAANVPGCVQDLKRSCRLGIQRQWAGWHASLTSGDLVGSL